MRIEYNYDLSKQNTFRMKVFCACYIEYASVKELESLDFDSLPQPVMSIGGGSNLLFTGDFPGTVLHSVIKTVKYVDMGLDEVPVIVGSGVCVDDFIAEVCGHGLWGMENLSLIPGDMGAAAVQNIGAYGVEIKDVISGVVCYDIKERKKVKFSTAECAYGYRDSMFKRSDRRYIVTSVLVRLSRKYAPKLEYKGVRTALGLEEGASPENLTPQMVRDAIIGVRKEKLPDPAEIGSAGSFFKNPVVDVYRFLEISEGYDTVPHFVLEGGFVKIPAAWMIDQCGFKGAEEGGAAVYSKQPLVIVNATGNASPEDVVRLESRIIETVKERFGVELHPEVEHI